MDHLDTESGSSNDAGLSSSEGGCRISALTALAIPMLLFFGSIVGLFDVLMLRGFADQVSAANFPSVPGTMQIAEVTRVSSPSGSGRGSGASHSLRVQYTYKVNRREYKGDRYSFVTGDTWTTSDKRRVADALRPPAQVPVYYDPDDPERAVLTNQLFAGDYFALLFLVPFNVMVLGTLWFVMNALRIDLLRPAFAGAPVRRTPRDVRVDLARLTPMTSAMLVLFASSFVMIFVLGFGVLPFYPSPIAVFAGLGGCLLAACLIWLKRRLRVGSGTLDLIIDSQSGRLRLPANYGRDEPLIVSTSDVDEIDVKEQEIRRKRGNGRRTAYVVRVRMHDRTIHRIAERAMPERAHALAADIATFAGIRVAS